MQALERLLSGSQMEGEARMGYHALNKQRGWNSLLRKAHPPQGGFSLIEVSVALGILGAALVAVLVAFAASARLSDRLHQNTTVLNLARSQLEFVQSQPYSDTQAYTTFSTPPESYAVETVAEPVTRQVLQKVTTTASGDDTAFKLETYKTNRLLETGLFPPSSGREIVNGVPITSPLPAQRGFFVVVNVPESTTEGSFSPSWEVDSKSLPDIQLTIYEGRPFGSATSGVSSLVPEALASFIVATGRAQGAFVRISSSIPGDTYTLYYFNWGNFETFTILEPVNSFFLNITSKESQGIATHGIHLWVVDDDPEPGRVFQYTLAGSLIGAFDLDDSNAQPEGIATDGTHLWVVDKGSDKVFRYTMTEPLSSSFSLDTANKEPRGITTDGIHLWVVDDDQHPGRVFQYTLDGHLEGSFALDGANKDPGGIAVRGSQVWVVDDGSLDLVFQYTTTGFLVAVFGLDAAQKDPKGIATDGVYLWVVDEEPEQGRVLQYRLTPAAIRTCICP